MAETNTEWTDFPTCPHCGVVDQDWADGLPPSPSKNDGDSWVMTCQDCGGFYVVTMCVTATFRTQKGEDYTKDH